MSPPPLRLLHCLPHTSFLGYIAAFSSNTWPCFGEIFNVFYFYNETTYVDQQTVVPSFWFRWWRPGFLIAGILYDVGMLAYCIYMEDVFAVLLVVRLVMGLYQLNDQLWMIKNWIPFFVQKEKQRFMFLRAYLGACIWYFVVGSTSWTGPWQDRNDVFACVYYISVFVIIFCCGLPYLSQGGLDLLIKYRLHWNRNVFGLLAISGMILGIIGLIIGDGEGDLIYTLDYHSVYVLIFFALEGNTALFGHRFIVVYEELSWKYPNNPISSPPPTTSTLIANNATASESTNPDSNNVERDLDISSIELMTTPRDSFRVKPSKKNTTAEGSSCEIERLPEDGKGEQDLEAACDLLFQSVTRSSKSTGNVDVPRSCEFMSSIRNTMTGKEQKYDLVDGATPPEDCIERTMNDVEPTKDNVVKKLVEEDGDDDEDLEAIYGLPSYPPITSVGDAPSVISPTITTPSPTRLSTFLSTGRISSLFSSFTSARIVDDVTQPISLPQNNDSTQPTSLSQKNDSNQPPSLCPNNGSTQPTSSSSPQDNDMTQPTSSPQDNDMTQPTSSPQDNDMTQPTSSSSPQDNDMTPETIMILKRHQFVLREVDKLFCIAYQMFVWETVMWLAQIFLTLYFEGVNTPTLPGAEGYYCPTPLETTINSAQYAHDLFFARR